MFLPSPIYNFTFIFENCESCTFWFHDIGNFYISEIKTEYRKLGFNSQVTANFIAEDLLISIHHKANLNCKDGWISGKSCIHSKGNLFDRFVQRSDITQIELESYNDRFKHSVNLRVPYGEDQYDNCYQQTRLNKRGDLFLLISKNQEKIEEFKNSNLDADIEHELFYQHWLEEQKQ